MGQERPEGERGRGVGKPFFTRRCHKAAQDRAKSRRKTPPKRGCRKGIRRHVRRLDAEIPPLDRLPARAPLHARRGALTAPALPSGLIIPGGNTEDVHPPGSDALGQDQGPLISG
jgi:hypothetical protein